MNLNLTLLGEAITFALFVWFTMKCVWPPLTEALEKRRQSISNQISQAEQQRQDAKTHFDEAKKAIVSAKQDAESLLKQAQRDADAIREAAEAKAKDALEEAKKRTEDELARLVVQAQQNLLAHTAELAEQAAQKILSKHNADNKALAELIGE